MSISAADPIFSEPVVTALGKATVEQLGEIHERAARLAASLGDAATTEFMVIPIPAALHETWYESARREGETWAYVQGRDGTLLAVDDVTDEGLLKPGQAVVYPSILGQLGSWWLVHAWRGNDLLVAALGDLGRWRLTTAPTLARALLEQVGCLVHQAPKLFDAWTACKSLTGAPLERPAEVRSAFQPLLAELIMGTRLPNTPDRFRATNVLTYLDALKKRTKDPGFARWYDWLSDASHPAYGARVALSGQPRVHEAGAVSVRFISQGVLSTVSTSEFVSGNRAAGIPENNEVAHVIAQSIIASAQVFESVLTQARALVEDFALTTNASRLTYRRLWPELVSAPAGVACPCGCGSTTRGDHRWGRPAPTLTF